MGKYNRQIKRQNHQKSEAERANKVIKSICMALILLAVLVIVAYALASKYIDKAQKLVETVSVPFLF